MVSSGQIEFVLGGWSYLETENILVEEIIHQYEEAQRWLFEEFGYSCSVAYLQPAYRLYRDIPFVLREGGSEMVIVDGMEDELFDMFTEKNSADFLWETDEFRKEESRLFTHLSPASQSLWSDIRSIVKE